jgi:hypothetical protein
VAIVELPQLDPSLGFERESCKGYLHNGAMCFAGRFYDPLLNGVIYFFIKNNNVKYLWNPNCWSVTSCKFYVLEPKLTSVFLLQTCYEMAAI